MKKKQTEIKRKNAIKTEKNTTESQPVHRRRYEKNSNFWIWKLIFNFKQLFTTISFCIFTNLINF